MQKAFVLALLLLGSAMAHSSLELKGTKNRPVTKVINLLKDMTKQLEAEGEEDEAIYDKMVCWCESNDKEKTKAIADAEQHISSLTASIEDLTANSATLTQEIATTEAEVGKSTAALEKATAMRDKELAEFNEADKEALQSIASLKSAVTVLGKHNSAAFLQAGTSAKAQLREVAHVLKKAQNKVADNLVPSQKKVLAAFLQSPEDYLLGLTQQPASAGSYAPQSGQIFGILKNMKESFEANADNARKEEADAVAQFQEMKAAKEDEIAAGVSQIQTKTQELANSDEQCATDKQTKKDTENTLTADREFLANLKATCADLDAQMEERSKTRTMEIEACSKALAVLSSDDAHDLFTKTFNFLQVSRSSTTTRASSRREKAAKVLEAAARRNHNPKLAMLASTVRLDAFKKVGEAIQKMVDDLVKEKEDEIAFKDYCIDAMNTNEHETGVKNKEKEDLVASNEELAQEVSTLSDQIKGLQDSIAEMRLQMKRAGEDRELENKEFMETVADQRATQQLLQKALDILKGFYDASLLQTAATKKQAPPVQFKDYSKNKQSGGVMGMIQGIISDAKRMEAEAITGESDSQKNYENFVKESNESIDAATVEITNASEAKAKTEAELSQGKTSLDAVTAQLEELARESRGLHGECDFVLKNFDVRQSSRDDEIEALKDSKSILSGATI